jgi:hypothetical protein
MYPCRLKLSAALTFMKKAILHYMNILLLRQVQQQILREPRQFMMTYVFFEGCNDSRLSQERFRVPNCNTAACIAGWTISISRGTSPKRAREETDGWLATAQALLCIPDQKLFLLGDWPTVYEKRWWSANNSQEQAQVASDVIDNYIETNGWTNI